MNCLEAVLLLLERGFLTFPKKLLSFFSFPLVYPFRNLIYRDTKAYSQNRWNILRVLKENRGFRLLVWFFFDDSIYSDFRKDYHPYKYQNKFFTLLDKIFHTEFFRIWYWCGLRNSSNNLSHYWAYKVGFYEETVKKCPLGIEIRKFSSHKKRPYLEWKIGKYIINIGWLKSGKFEGPKIRKR